MIYISFVELFAQSQSILMQQYGEKMGMSWTVVFFFIGILFIGIIDRLVPSVENPHEVRSIESMKDKPKTNAKLMRVGVMTALVIGIHNFPEGIATFISAMENPKLGIAIAVAVAIHNIPEGIAVSIQYIRQLEIKERHFAYPSFQDLQNPLEQY